LADSLPTVGFGSSSSQLPFRKATEITIITKDYKHFKQVGRKAGFPKGHYGFGPFVDKTDIY